MAKTAEQRIEYIIEAVKKESPDILLTSGYSLDNNDDLSKLVKKLSSFNVRTNILIEVKMDDKVLKNGHPLIKSSKNKIFETGTHCMFLITNRQEVKRLGAQIFAQSKEVSGKAKSDYIKTFHDVLKTRIFEVNGKKAIALCCGEINVIQGRDNIKFISKESEDILRSCDLILNPTHDCMANYGTLKAKRKYLSKMKNSNSIYVSSSNWNSCKALSNGKTRKQSRNNSFMQNVYQNGFKVEMKRITDTEDYLLNTAQIIN